MKTIISILTVVGIAFGAYFYIDNRYAQCEDVKKIERRLDYKIIADQLKSVQDRIWRLEDRNAKEKVIPKSVKEEQRQLEEDKNLLQKKLEVLENK